MAIFVAKRHRPGQFDWPRSGQFGKADAADIDRMLAQQTRMSAQVRQAYVDAVRRLGDQVDVDALADLIRQGRVSEALQQINAQTVQAGYVPFVNTVTAAIFGAAHDAANVASSTTGGIDFSFSQVNPEAVRFAQGYEMNLIRELSSDTLGTVRQVISQGVSQGDNPIDIARDVRQYIGLTQRQAAAVSNYRRLLENQDGQALTRALRDRRFDPSLRSHVAGTRALSRDQIDSMVSRYGERYLKYRAETIARTEAKRALGSGNQLLWNQAVASGKLDEDQVTKTWLTVGDHKVRPAHVELDGQTVGLNDPFTCSYGEIAYPGDPGADPGMTINCRCTAIYRFKLRDKDKTPPDGTGGGIVSTAVQGFLAGLAGR